MLAYILWENSRVAPTPDATQPGALKLTAGEGLLWEHMRGGNWQSWRPWGGKQGRKWYQKGLEDRDSALDPRKTARLTPWLQF